MLGRHRTDAMCEHSSGFRAPPPSAGFHDFEEFERLVDAETRKRSPEEPTWWSCSAGEAGLRRGEIRGAASGSDVDLKKRQLCVPPIGLAGPDRRAQEPGRLRYVPLTQRLAAALQGRSASSRGRSCFATVEGQATERECLIADHVDPCGTGGKVGSARGVHVLRHTFCSHLAMSGRTGKGDSGTRRTPGSADDPALHALESSRIGRVRSDCWKPRQSAIWLETLGRRAAAIRTSRVG